MKMVPNPPGFTMAQMVKDPEGCAETFRKWEKKARAVQLENLQALCEKNGADFTALKPHIAELLKIVPGLERKQSGRPVKDPQHPRHHYPAIMMLAKVVCVKHRDAISYNEAAKICYSTDGFKQFEDDRKQFKETWDFFTSDPRAAHDIGREMATSFHRFRDLIGGEDP